MRLLGGCVRYVRSRQQTCSAVSNSQAQNAPSRFSPIAVNALYPSIERGLSADILAARALGGRAYPVCTAHVVAGNGMVTDVLDVPTDTISAQLEHVLNTGHPTAARVGIINHPATVEVVFDVMQQVNGPFVLDLTLSGPSGEDIINQRSLERIQDRLEEPDLVTMRMQDAQLVAGMEIPSLDDAQVAIQRIGQLGAQRLLMRCGRISSHFYDLEAQAPSYAVDLYYDGEDFAVFEAPHLEFDDVHGASSALMLSLLRHLQDEMTFPDALQQAKAYVTEALNHCAEGESPHAPNYFWKRSQESVT